MNLKTYKTAHDKPHLLEICSKVGSSYEYVWEQLTGSHSKASASMAIKIEKATGGKVSRQEIRPDIYL
jgi:DNA-binding transcriptional regulator YdaS (Cro superfamily)